MIKVLLVEDDPVIARIISFYLKQESHYEVVCATTGGEAFSHSREQFDVILLDVLLPDVNGIDLCAKLREWHNCPIIFISALDNSETIVTALEAGGDDFITKPFDNKVLAAHIEANIRRANQIQPDYYNSTLVCEGFSFDRSKSMVIKDDQLIKLSPQEARILALFMNNPNRFFSADEIYKRIWERESYGDTRSVVVHIHNIRKKIGDNDDPRFIKNIWGKGYIFDPTGKKGIQEL
ncbi:MAG: response regulator transcription factor [Coriobacteriales bacterium]|nr:response regulator transcription factor [Coriobacteriales bacterium]